MFLPITSISHYHSLSYSIILLPRYSQTTTMRLTLIFSVFAAVAIAAPNACTPNGLPCNSQTNCCSGLCMVDDLDAEPQNGSCAQNGF
ncbi:hypothetical protein BDV25DRAFT_139355 [Aspergillus avenaceus]|uniref:Uncharacterized protein n=1 Tax=Aspergillus avenaceus TaxID=36643 RepID=A0A5N6TX87_ASPAV|nr:hypothetical protein BDV25DRAFT_139355 [Aspergillus avenaceus]